MESNETELGDSCSKCGGVSYQGGYCFRCGTYRPSKHNLRDEELDAASFMEGNFGKRIEAFYAEADALAESEELTSPDYRPRGRIYGKPQKRTISPSSQEPSPCAPITPIPIPPPPKPELTFLELIDIINRRGTTKTPEPLPQLTDTTSLPDKAQSNQLIEAAPTPTHKPDISPIISHEPLPPQAHVSGIHPESASTGHIAPPAVSSPRAETVVSCPPTHTRGSAPPPLLAPPQQAPRSSYPQTFLAIWILISVSLSERNMPVLTAIIIGAMFSVFLSFFVSFAIDWLIEKNRK
jgi:hypothetical protein